MRIILKKENGITLASLAIIIIILLIIASIGFSSSKNLIKNSNLESLKTNMLLIQAKAKEYVEEVVHEMGIKPEDLTQEQKEEINQKIYIDKAQMKKSSEIEEEIKSKIISIVGDDLTNCYYLDKNTLENMGLNNIEVTQDNFFFVIFDEQDISVEVYNSKGYEGVYSLTQIQEL